MDRHGNGSTRTLLLGATLALAALLLGPSVGEAQFWTEDAETAPAVQLPEPGETIFGRIGGRSIYLNRIGSVTVGRIGRETIYLDRLGSSTFGRIGNRRVWLDRIEAPTWSSDPAPWSP